VIAGKPTTGLGRIFEPPAERPVEDELRAAYTDDAQERGLEVQTDRPFIERAAEMPTPKRPLDLDRFRFQRELYTEQGLHDRELIVKKAAQIGVSEWLVRWMLILADLGATVLYIMPRLLQATEFSDMRVKRVIEASAYLRTRQDLHRTSKTDTKRLKSIGEGFVAIRGSKSEAELISVDADAVAMDEYDRLVIGNLPQVEQRVTGPMSRGQLRKVSTPTIPNFGISKEFLRTDQRRWHVRCGGLSRRGKRGAGCGEWVRMSGMETYLDVLDHDDAVLRCPRCRRELDVREGEWVAEFTDGDRPRGYHAPKFVVPGVNLAGIVERGKRTSAKERKSFHNEDLGEDWMAESAGLTQDQLMAAVRAYTCDGSGYVGFKPVTMGIDVAASRALNVRISEHLSEHQKRALWIGEIDDGRAPWGPMPSKSAFEILTLCLERFRVRMAVIDYMPDPRIVRAWCERHRGRVFRVQWHDKLKAVLTRPDPKGDPTKLNARYLEGIDATLDLIRQQKNLLPDERPEDFDDHLKARVLDTVEDEETGEVVQRWVRTGPDDYLQAEAYDVIATHMMYVQQAGGAIGGASGHVVATRPDVVEQQGDDLRGAADDGLDYSPGPDENPASGW
jgi:hypothetical protein